MRSVKDEGKGHHQEWSCRFLPRKPGWMRRLFSEMQETEGITEAGRGRVKGSRVTECATFPGGQAPIRAER